MTEGQQFDARRLAQRLIKEDGFERAKHYVIREMDSGAKHRQDYWLQVWRELKSLQP